MRGGCIWRQSRLFVRRKLSDMPECTHDTRSDWSGTVPGSSCKETCPRPDSPFRSRQSVLFQKLSDTDQAIWDRTVHESRGELLRNAPMESWFGTLKMELTHHRHYKTRHEAIQEITECIEIFYNRQRRHAKPGNISPAAFERKVYKLKQVA